MRSLASNGIISPVVFKGVRCSRRVQLWNRQASIIMEPDHSGPSSRGALPSARMSTEEVMKTLGGTQKGHLRVIVRRQRNWVSTE
jgi:hypothetical protein